MKISKSTIEILQNFSNINESILILEGNEQKTLSPIKSGYAEAKLEDSFPKECGIFKLSMFLGILSLFKDPDIDFSENSFIITEGVHKATYRFCNPSLITFPPKGKTIDPGQVTCSFELSADNLKLLLKAVSLYGHDVVTIVADGSKIFVKSENPKEKDSDGFYNEIGETDQTFEMSVKIENLNLLPHSYDVSVTDKNKVVFRSKNMDLMYVVPTVPTV